MNDITFLRMVISRYGRRVYQDIRDKHYRALKMLARGRSYAMADVPEEERQLFIKHCCLYGRIDPEYVVLLNDDYVCRRTPNGDINYPTNKS